MSTEHDAPPEEHGTGVSDLELLRESVRYQERTSLRLDALERQQAEMLQNQSALAHTIGVMGESLQRIADAEVARVEVITAAEQARAEAEEKEAAARAENDRALQETVTQGMKSLLAHPAILPVIGSVVTYLLLQFGIPIGSITAEVAAPAPSPVPIPAPLPLDDRHTP